MKKALLIGGGILIALAIGLFFYLKNRKLTDFNPLIREKLQSLVLKGSDSLYRLTFDTLIADVIDSRLTVTKIVLTPDTTVLQKMRNTGNAPKDIFKVSLDSLVVDGLNIADFTSNKNVDLNVLHVRQPSVEVFHAKTPKQDSADRLKLSTLRIRIAKQMNHLAINKVQILDMNVQLHTLSNDTVQKTSKFRNVNFLLDDVLIDSVAAIDSTRFMYSKQALISLQDLKFRTKDSLYLIGLDSITINASEKNVLISNFYIKPNGTNKAFRNKLKFIKERYTGQFKTVELKQISWWSIASSDYFRADEVHMNNGSLEVYTDRSLPPFPRSKVGNFPHQLLMKSPFPINLKRLKVTNFDLSYQEFNPKTDEKGEVSFKDINGTLENITNDPQLIAQNNIMKLDASAKPMGEGKLDAIFKFYLDKAKDGIFSVDAFLHPMDGRAFDKATRPLGMFGVEKATIKGMDVHVDGTNYNGRGTVVLKYDDLQIAALKQDGDKLKKRGFLSFIANSFVLIPSNPEKNTPVRKASAYYRRDVHKSFFSIIWKTILIGIMKTVGFDSGVKKVK
ncbi:hypothetical protein QTN47_08465 [Danxiaibacter flavus]|uniref:DUF748 domain-containing protein n=1 Tax=Danxiaibacter flavus TaxID=3049108 RepID=A0ABV3ZDD0_9BACT|nr:hypothetical protein QNM32_08465 [Chitinophagaceae bacterium DXS]